MMTQTMTQTRTTRTTTTQTRTSTKTTNDERERRRRRRRRTKTNVTDDDDDVQKALDAMTAKERARGLRAHARADVKAKESDEMAFAGVVARERIEENEAIFTRAIDAAAYDAEYARSDDASGLARALRAVEERRKRNVSDEIALALLLTSARRHGEMSELGAYAMALPKEACATPVMYDDETMEAFASALALTTVDAVDEARREFAMAHDVAREIVKEIPGEDDLEEEEFAWAWSMVRSRAITFAVRKSTGEIERKRCLVPVCDVLNHSPTSLRDCDVDYDPSTTVVDDGPNVRIATNGGGESVWMTTRAVAAGEALRWTYGELSNEEMWLWYGFVPANPVHGDCSVPFNLPDAVFKSGLDAVAKDDAPETMALRKRLLERAGVLGLNQGEELSFVLSIRGPPKTLGGIAGVMCCDADEVVAIAASAVISANGGGGDGASFSIKPESRRRAGRYVAWLLTQVETFVCGATDDDIVDLERVARDIGGTFESRFNDVKALRVGARATFAIVQRRLTDAALLANGDWIDEATKRLVGGGSA